MVPRVRIVMATKNRSKLLDRAIYSIKKQLYTNWELLVFDDNSTDDTKEVLINLCSSDNRIREYIKAPSQNFNEVRQALMMESPTDLVVALDDDDYWTVPFLDKVVRTFDRTQSKTIVYTDCLLVNEKGEVRHEDTSKGFPYPDLLPSLTVFKTEAFKKVGGWRLDIFTFKGVAIHGELNNYLELRKVEEPTHIPEPLVWIYRTSTSMGAGRELNAHGTLILMNRWATELRSKPKEWATLNCRAGIHFMEAGVPTGRTYFKEAIRTDPKILIAWIAYFTSFLGPKLFVPLLNLYKRLSGFQGKKVRKENLSYHG